MNKNLELKKWIESKRGLIKNLNKDIWLLKDNNEYIFIPDLNEFESKWYSKGQCIENIKRDGDLKYWGMEWKIPTYDELKKIFQYDELLYDRYKNQIYKDRTLDNIGMNNWGFLCRYVEIKNIKDNGHLHILPIIKLRSIYELIRFINAEKIEFLDYQKEEERKKLYEIAVVATMSSGKSTFINSLIGREILSARNTACTADVIKIFNKEENKEFVANIVDSNNNRENIEIKDDSYVEKFNNGELNNMIIEGAFSEIRNGERKLVIIDTPGVNNARDLKHKEITYKFLEGFNKDMIIYLINATQFGTDDDYILLSKVAENVKRKNLKLIIIINKIDEFDIENESINELIMEVYKYVEQFNISNAQIFPVASLGALLFRRLLNNNEIFTRKNKMDLLKLEGMFSNEGFSEEISRLLVGDINEDEKEALSNKVIEAISNTGINKVEEAIMKELEGVEKTIRINSNIKHESLLIKKKNVESTLRLKSKNQKKIIQSKDKNKRNQKKRGIKMSDNLVSIEYNPYKSETKILINGETIGSDKFRNRENQRIQFLLGKDSGSNWEGLIEELKEEINDSFNIEFKGRKIDYEDLQGEIEVFNTQNGTNIATRMYEIKEDAEMMHDIEKLVDEFKVGPIEELRSKSIIDEFESMKNQEFDINVLATMSAGKSTLINSMIGYELLPSKNMACTATIARLRSRNEEKITAECRDKNENVIRPRKECSLEDLKKYNEDKEVMYMDIDCRLENISSKNMQLVLVDTPGPNNSRNENHGAVTESIIKDKNKSVVLYVMNATQLETNDDKRLLTFIANEMKRGGKQSKDRFIFVINKCDTVDTENEPIDKLLVKVKEYLSKVGIENPNLFPVTAELAKVIRKKKNMQELTFKEKIELPVKLDYFSKYEKVYFDRFAVLSPSCRDRLNKRLEYAKKNNDINEIALIHSGVPAVEETIKEYLDKYAYPIKIEKAISNFRAIIEEKEMLNKLDETINADEDARYKIREQIEVAEKTLRDGEKLKKIKDDISNLNIDYTMFKSVKKEVLDNIRKETNKYKDKKNIEIGEARNVMEIFGGSMQEIQKKLELQLEVVIEETVRAKAQELVKKYQQYLEEFNNKITIAEFKFDKISKIKALKIDNAEELIEKNSSLVAQYEKVYHEAEKKWWNPFTWFNEGYFTEDHIGDKKEINAYEALSQALIPINTVISQNIEAFEDQAKKDIIKIKNKCEIMLTELDKAITEEVGRLKASMSADKVIEKRIETNEELKNWLKNIIKKLNSILEI